MVEGPASTETGEDGSPIECRRALDTSHRPCRVWYLSQMSVSIVRQLKSVTCILPVLALAACAQATQSAQTEQAEKPAAAATAGNQTPAAPAPPKPLIATSPDGTKIAYEVTGTGPALMLVHGGGQTRRTWNQIGYVDRLSKQYQVITVDLRGTGDSDKPMTPGAYAVDKVTADLLAVADAAGVKAFHLWGFGHGATIARYLASQSERVESAVLIGMTMGPAVTGVLKDAVTAMRDKWQPLIEAHAAGKLDVEKLPASDRTAWEAGVPVNALSLGALLDYPPITPADIKVPTLWLVGADDSAAENAKEYEGKLAGTNVTLKIVGSLNYSDSFTRIDQVVAEVEPFLEKNAAVTGD